MNLPIKPSRRILKILAIPLLLMSLCMFQQAVWYSGKILGDLNVKHTFHETHNQYRVKIASHIIGYMDLSDFWVIQDQYAYGTLKEKENGDTLYFLYDCQDDSYLTEAKLSVFRKILAQHNLVWKDILSRENIAKLKYGTRLYSDVCSK